MIDVINNGTAGFNSLIGQARTVGNQINSALNTAAAGGAGGGGASQAFDPFSGLRATVSMTRAELAKFYEDNARQFNKVLGKDIPNAAQLADADLARFHSQLMGVNTTIPHSHNYLKQLNQMFALQNLAMAANNLKQFGLALGRLVNDGMEDAMQLETALVKAVEGVLVNNPDIAKSLEEGGREAYRAYAEGIIKGTDENPGLNKLSKKIGLGTTFTDNQVAQGIAILLQSGVKLDDVLGGVAESMAHIAMIGDVEIPKAAKHMVAIYNQFGSQLKDQFGGDVNAAFTYVADVINNSLRSSGVSLESFMNSLTYSGAISALAGQSFGDTASVLALFAKHGIEGSKSGTALRRVITSLTPNTDKAQEAMRRMVGELGMSEAVFYDAEGRMKSLTEVQAIMFEAMKDKSPQEQIYLLRTIFGQYAIGQALILANAEEFDNLTEQINQSGTAQRQVANIMESSAGIHDRLNEAWATLKEVIGDTNLNYLNPLKTNLTEIIEKFVLGDEKTQALVATLVGATAVVATLGGSFLQTAANIALTVIALNMAGISLGVVAIAALKIIAVIALIVAAAYLVYQAYQTNFLGFADIVDATFGRVKAALDTLVTNFKTWYGENKATIDDFIVLLFRVWDELSIVIVPLVKATLESLVRIIGAVLETIIGVIDNGLTIITGIFQFWTALFTGDWEGVWNATLRIIDGAIELVKSLMRGLFDVLWAVVETSLKAIVEMFGGSWDDISAKFTSWFEGFRTAWQERWNVVKAIFATIAAIVRGDWDAALDGIAKATGANRETILSAINAIIYGISTAFNSLVASAFSWGANIVNSIANGISSAIGSVTSAVSGVATKIKDFLGFQSPTKLGPGAKADEWMPNLVNMLADDLTAMRPTLQASLGGVAMDIHAGVAMGGGVPLGAGGGRVVNLTIINNAPTTPANNSDLATKVRRQIGSM